MMSVEEKYEPAAWTRISRLPYLIAMAMEGAGRSGITGSASERLAMVRGLAAGKSDFVENPLIQGVVPDTDGEHQLLEETTRTHDEILDCLADSGIDDHPGLLKHIFKILPRVLSDIEARETPETIAGYKSWILEMSEGIAKAGKEGDILGFGGVWFSEQEQNLYKKLQKHLD